MGGDDGVGGGDGVGVGVSMVGGDGGDVESLAAGANTAGQFVCEPCSKEYKTEETYRAHVSAHKKVCPWPLINIASFPDQFTTSASPPTNQCTTCDFMAVPRVLKEHELVFIMCRHSI